MHAIEAWNLHKTYKGGVRALADLSFTVDGGTIFALLEAFVASIAAPDSRRADHANHLTPKPEGCPTRSV